MSVLNLVSLLGICLLAGLAWAIGGCQRPIAWRTILGSGGLMLALGGGLFMIPQALLLLVVLNDLILALLGASRAGAEFLFGPLALNPGESTRAGESSIGFVLAVQVLPALVFFAAMMSAAYYAGLVQPIIRLFARLFRKTLSLSGAESLAGASNIFVGVESALAIRPYLSRMTRSELLTLLTCAMATVASTTLGLYVFFLQDSIPQIAGHLISASVISIPAAVLISKLMLPESETPETMGVLPPLEKRDGDANLMAAISTGAWDGLKLAAGIASMLIAVLGVVALVDLALEWMSSPFSLAVSEPLNLERILGWIFTPLAWMLGVNSADLIVVAELLGKRAILTEVVAYQELGALSSARELSPRSILVLSYALCGFAHVASVGIFVGGISAIVPERRNDLSAMALHAFAASTLTTLMTGAIAGVFYHGQQGVLGL
jgi:CNT family concentrative nucleoside transporter